MVGLPLLLRCKFLVWGRFLSFSFFAMSLFYNRTSHGKSSVVTCSVYTSFIIVATVSPCVPLFWALWAHLVVFKLFTLAGVVVLHTVTSHAGCDVIKYFLFYLVGWDWHGAHQEAFFICQLSFTLLAKGYFDCGGVGDPEDLRDVSLFYPWVFLLFRVAVSLRCCGICIRQVLWGLLYALLFI